MSSLPAGGPSAPESAGDARSIVAAIQAELLDGADGANGRIADLLCRVDAGSLGEVDRRVGSLGQEMDLVGLVTQVLGDEDRERVLAHFDSFAPSVRGPRVRLVSDVDDTVFVSAHDRRYPRGTVYPGVRAFQLAVQAGPEGNLPTSEETFVTARPSDALGILDGRLRASLVDAGVEDPVVMSGSLAGVVSVDARVASKLENLRLFLRIHNDAQVVYMGDSGMADPRVCRELRDEMPEAFVAAFIHDISGTPVEEREGYAAAGVFFHDTYVGAAVNAHRLGLIPARGVRGVARATIGEFDEVTWSSDEQERVMRELLARDLAAATALDHVT